MKHLRKSLNKQLVIILTAISLYSCGLDELDRKYAAEDKLKWDRFVSDTVSHKNDNGIIAAKIVVRESLDTGNIIYCYKWLRSKGLTPKEIDSSDVK